MIKSIKMKKVIGENPEKRLEEELMEKDLYISLDDIPTDQKYDCDKVAGYLYTDASGNSNTIELMEVTYSVKETYAPPGYAKDTETYTVKIESEETTSFTSKEEPITDLVELLLTKNPVGYPHDYGEGDATLKGAVYKFSY